VRVLYVTGLVVAIDQATKLLIKGFSIPALRIYHPGLQLGESMSVIGDFFRITFVENPGMAFGIDAGSKFFLTAFTILATVGICYYLYRIRRDPLPLRMSLALILGGAIGNLIDRVFYGVIFGEGPLLYGKVVDFFDIDFFDIALGDYHLSRWFVFNVADAAVSLGVVLMLFAHRSAERAQVVSVPSASVPTVTAESSPSDPSHPST